MARQSIFSLRRGRKPKRLAGGSQKGLEGEEREGRGGGYRGEGGQRGEEGERGRERGRGFRTFG
jgi:hypothetical protein